MLAHGVVSIDKLRVPGCTGCSEKDRGVGFKFWALKSGDVGNEAGSSTFQQVSSTCWCDQVMHSPNINRLGFLEFSGVQKL